VVASRRVNPFKQQYVAIGGTPDTSRTIRMPETNDTLAADGYHLPRLSEEHHVNGFARTAINGPHSEEPAQELPSQRRKPEIGQFRLHVDRQAKATFSTHEAAAKAGTEIKRGHPVVQVAVYDTVECSNWIIELPET